MTPWPPHLYRKDAAVNGVDTVTVRNSLAHARRVQAKGLPAILTLKHLSVMAAVPYKDLRQAVERRLLDPYRYFHVKKRSGGNRLICVPHPSLFRVQKWLARYVLRDAEVHRCSRAYGRKQSIVACAHDHCGCRWLIKIDIQQFFESVSERQVYHVFRGLGYEPLISFELGRLCTRVPEKRRRYSPRWVNQEQSEPPAIRSYEQRSLGNLPQGAPTSPMVSNLAVRELDEELSELAEGIGFAYTRYADDLIFSHAGEFSREQAQGFVRQVYERIVPHGFRPHTAKTVIAPPGARKVVLGLLVDRERPRLRREFKARLDQHLYCIAHNGPAVHAQRRGFRSIFSLHQYILGLISYAGQVDTNYADDARKRFNSADWLF